MTTWSKDEVEALGRHIDNGLTGSQTARRLRGRTRNSVIGKAWKLGWSFGAPRTEAEALRATRRTAATLRASRQRPGHSVCTTFDDDTYAAIMQRVKTDKSTRAQIIRELVEWGLEA